MSGFGTDGIDLVAVVGMSCRLPGAADTRAFWELLRDGREAVREAPADRQQQLGLDTAPRGGWLDEVDGFDASFFGISPREAVAMDPQQRLALELTYHAFESAGMRRDALRGGRVGVYVGTIWSDYAELLADTAGDHHQMTGLARSIIANRISYAFGVRGPSMTVDCGQSSSLVAVHLACEALRHGEADVTIAGGVNLVLTGSSTERSLAFGGLSPDGRCFTFDERGNGYVRGEGGALVALKRLDRAILDGDPVYAVVAGSAVGNDGRTDTLTTPDASAQAEVITAACLRAGVSPSALQYVELHGTGTPVGDPLEAAALGWTAGRDREAGQRLRVGSVKTNLGHLEGAAGVVGLVKTVLALQHRALPASLNFRSPPADIPLDDLGLAVQTELGPWPDPDQRLLAGVSSFGMGGTNCHLVLTEAPPVLARRAEDAAPAPVEGAPAVPWLLSARSRPARSALATALVPAGRRADRAAIASALVRRDRFEHRAVVVGTGPDLDTELAWLGDPAPVTAPPEGVVVGAGPAPWRDRPVLVFPGQGAQWVGMGRELLAASPAFRDRFAACSRALRAAGGPDAEAVVTAAAPDGLDAVEVVQPVSWAVMVSLAAVWDDAGVHPGAVVGHSQGEIAAAVVAGAIGLEDGARVVTARAQALRALAGHGGMLSVAAPEDTVAARLAEIADDLVVAAVNGPSATVVSGRPGDLDRLAAGFETDGVRCRRVAVDYASHSPMVESVRDDILAAVAGAGGVETQPARVPWWSTVTGTWIDGTEATATYWVENLRRPVRFADAVAGLVAAGHTTFVECSAHPVLTGAVEDAGEAARTALTEGGGPGETGGGAEIVALATLRRDQGGRDRLLTAFAEAWVNGVEVRWSAVLPAATSTPRELPPYPFQHTRFWPGGSGRATPAARRPAPDGPDPAPEGAEGGLAALSPEAARAAVLDTVRRTTATLLGHADPAEVAVDATFRDLGVDSVTAVELRTSVGGALGVRLPKVTLFDHPTPTRLAAALLDRVRGDAAAAGDAAGDAAGAAAGAAVAAPRVDGPAAPDDDPVVVVGMACRFPGGVRSPEDLWEVLAEGRDTTSAFPTDRGWPTELFDADPDRGGRAYVRRGGFVTDAAAFDAGFFGISPREALAMDPQQRLVLETAWEVFERAGADPREAGATTGVFLGAMAQDYGPRMHRPSQGLDGYLLTGGTPSVASGRVAYVMGLEGPALTVDTACSSSLVALHLASASLLAGECDRAVVGGVTVLSTPGIFVEFSRQRGLAPDGRCKPFAAAADGTGWGEGAGVVLVERLSTARAAGHRVLAVVRGSAVNSDGASNGLSAPSGAAQQRVVRAALERAGLAPGDVDAVEAHGTGTALGDPIEAEALLATYGRGRDPERPLWLGSVKSNLGHTQAAAGVAGLITTVLALEHGVLPATLHVDEPSPHVDWDAGGVRLRREAVDWSPAVRPRRAGVSSFGISGTNAHVIVEEPPPAAAGEPARDEPLAPSPVPWPFSATDAERLDALAGRLAALADSADAPDPAAVAAALARRPAHAERAVRLPAGPDDDGPVTVRGRVSTRGGGTVFVFPGQGSQWVGMGAELLAAPGTVAAAFAERLRECARAVAAAGGPDVEAVLTGGLPLDDVAVVQPASWAVAVALAAAWEQAGVVPAAVIGHSQGEIAAAVVAGALSVTDGARVVTVRAQALREVAGSGAMASIGEPDDAVGARLAATPGTDGVAIAAQNGPSSVVVAGPVGGVAALVDAVQAAGGRARRVEVDYASHTAGMEVLRDAVVGALAGVRATTPRVPWLSTTRLEWAGVTIADAAYWFENLRSPVRFAPAVTQLLAAGFDAFVEVSAHPVLVPALVEIADAERVEVAASGTLHRGEDGPRRWAVALAEAWTGGVGVDWRRLLPARPVPAALPTYPFRAEHHWAAPEDPDAVGAPAPRSATDPLNDELWRTAEEGDVDAAVAALGVAPDAPLPAVLAGIADWRARRTVESRVDAWRHRVVWTPAVVSPPGTGDDAGSSGSAGRLLVLVPVDDGGEPVAGAAAALAGLTAAGDVDRVAVQRHELAPGSLDALATRLTADLAALADPAPRLVVSLLALAGSVRDTGPATGSGDAVAPGVTGLLAALRAVDQATPGAPLWAVTRAAVTVDGDDGAPDPAAAQVWGLGRTAALEHPRSWGGLIDLGRDDDTGSVGHLVALLGRGPALAGSPDGEDQIALRGEQAWARRLVADTPAPDAVAPFRTSGTALVTGGTGALGAHVAHWLADAGSERIVLTGRRGAATPGAEELRADLAARGVEVEVVACDVTDLAAVRALVERFPPDLVVHAAGTVVLEPLAATGGDTLVDVLGAKVAGAENLDAAVGDRPLDGFVLFSSISGVWGVADHGAYAAANAALDALAHRRAAAGRTALSVAWGPWSGGGMIAESLADVLARRGVPLIDPGPAVVALDRALARGDHAVVLADVDWATFAPVFTSARPTRLLDELPAARVALEAAGAPEGEGAAGHGAARDAGGTGGLGARLRDLSRHEQERIVLDVVRTDVASVLGHDGPTAVDPARAFSEAGLDSLGAVALRRALARSTGLGLSTSAVFDHPSPERLAARLLTELAPDATTPDATTPDTPAGAAGHADHADADADAADDPVVLVGMACRFPGGVSSPQDLWEVLAAGRDVTSELPSDRGWPALFDPDPDRGGHTYVRRGGFLHDAAAFDADFFGISPREALAMDPQQRLLLETSWEALERAGIDPRAERGSRTGVYVGLADQNYGGLVAADGAEGHLVTGAAGSVASGRVAYVLGLEGPALTVDTACSSSLVALHLAARALVAGECERALVSGVMVMANPDPLVRFSRQRALAPDGRCKPFAAAADGFALSEGAATVVVERLSAARAAGHPVLAVVRGSAINSDGASNGLSAPNGQAQQRVIRDALAAARLGPRDVDAVEAHGTGTELGDPIEAEALMAAYGRERAEPLWVGSIKSNIGHTQTAAGLGGLIKTVLAIQHAELPATLHVDAPSPHVDWDDAAVRLVTERRPWARNGHPRRGAVSSFGISGTNAHVVIEEPPAEEPGEEPGRRPAGEPGGPGAAPVPWVVSAHDEAALAAVAGSLAGPAAPGHDPVRVARALIGRTAFAERAVVLATGAAARVAALDELAGTAVGDPDPDPDAAAGAAGEPAVVVRGQAPGVRRPVFVFPGQGAQWVGMGAALLTAPGPLPEAFAERLRECSAAVVAAGGPDVVAVLATGEPLDDVGVVQPASWAVMVALAAAWEAAGVVPAAVLGHSQGEIAAAVVAGALSVADGARVVTARALALRAVAGSGAMGSVGETEDAARERVTALGAAAEGVEVAAVNAPSSVVVAGPVAGVEAVLAGAEAQGRRARRIAVDYASHTAGMEPLRETVTAALRDVVAAAPRIPWWSTTRSAWLREPVADAGYWFENLRSPVRFGPGVAALLAAGHDTFVEVSAHPVLAHAVVEAADAAGVEAGATGTLRRDDGGADRLLTALAQAWVGGVEVDWTPWVGEADPRAAATLPTYPFRSDRYWPAPAPPVPAATGPAEDPAETSFWAAVEGADTATLTRTLAVGADDLTGVVPALASWRRRRERARVTAPWQHRIDWAPARTSPVDPDAAAGDLLVLVPPDPRPAAGVLEALRAATPAGAVRTVAVGSGETRAGLAATLRAAGDPAVVVSLLAWSPPGEVTDRTVLAVAALVDAGLDAPWWWVTAGAVGAVAGDGPDADRAELWGLGLVAGLDHPDRAVGLIDLPVTPGDADLAALTALVGAVASGHAVGEDQLAVRAGVLLARRLVAGDVAATAAAPPWRTSGTALVTGGTGALGGHAARWLAAAGAEHLVLTSRRGPDAPGAAELRAELEALGARVTVAACDAADRDALAALLAEHPVRSVVHTAGTVGVERALPDTDPAEVAAVLRNKVAGAEHLDALLGDTDLDAFVLYSSGAAAWGNAGQAAYAAANAHLDALALRRRARGRTALAVAWGAWSAGGMVGADTAAALAELGVREMDPEAACSALGDLLGAGATSAVVADVDWDRLVPLYTAARPRPLLDEHPEARRVLDAERGAAAGVPADPAPGGDRDRDREQVRALLERLAAADPGERERLVVEVVRRTAAAALGHGRPASVGARRSFTDLGFESLTAVDFRNRLTAATGRKLPATAVYDHPTPQRLAAHLLEMLAPDLGPVRPHPGGGEDGGVESALTTLAAALGDPGAADGLAARLRELAERAGTGIPTPAGPTDPAVTAEGPVDPDLDDVSDDEMFDLIDEELGAV